MSNREQRYIKWYLIASVLALLPLTVGAQDPDIPKLMVCITADQWDAGVLEQIKPYLGNDGFRRLQSRGTTIQKVLFPFAPINGTSASTTLSTGALPVVHGVSDESVLVSSDGLFHPILEDRTQSGEYTRLTVSPVKLFAGTIADELKSATGGKAIVYSVAPDAAMAIAAVGGCATGAYWIDNQVGSWASTRYYGAMPDFLNRYNRSENNLSKNLTQRKWIPQKNYSGLPYKASQSFRHYFKATRYADFKKSALVNEEVTRLARLLIEQGGYAQSQSPGWLSLAYYCGPHTSEGDGAMLTPELVDTYVRLDSQLAELFAVLDRTIGNNKYVVSFSGTGYALHPRRVKQNIKTFSPQKCKTLLNLFLKAVYGGNEWVKAITPGGIYLNDQYISKRKLNPADVQAKAAELVEEMEGVSRVVTSETLRSGLALNPECEYLRCATHRESRPDLLMMLHPDWQYAAGELMLPPESMQTTWQTEWHYVPLNTPLYIMGGDMPRGERITTPVRVTQIAPTLCGILKIRPPNGCVDSAIELKK